MKGLRDLCTLSLLLCITQLNALIKNVLYRARHVSCTKLHDLQEFHTHLTNFLISDSNQQISDISASFTDINPVSLTNAAILVAGGAYLALEAGPQGSAEEELLEIAPSKVYRSKLAVVAKQFIPKDTEIGEFPGYVKTEEEFEKSKKDAESIIKAKVYAWQLSDQQILDPTSRTGQLPSRLRFLLGLRSVSSMMSRVSPVPPTGSKFKGKCEANLYVEEEGTRVWFLAKKDINPGEELFVEDARYLALLDEVPQPSASVSSGTNDKTPKAQAVAQENIDVEPIVASSGPLPDDDDDLTSALSAEDQELLEELLRLTRGDSRGLRDLDAGLFSDDEEDDDDKAVAGSSEDKGRPSGASVKKTMDKGASNQVLSDSADLVFNKVLKQMEKDLLQASEGATNSSTKDDAADIMDSVLTPQELAELEKQVGSLSDQEVEEAFSSLRSSFQSSLRSEIESFRREREKKSSAKKGSKGFKRASSVASASTSEKEKKVVEELERVFGDMMANPLSVWGEILKNPEKYMEEDDNAGNSAVKSDKKKN